MDRIMGLAYLAIAHRYKLIEAEGNFLHKQTTMYTTLMDNIERERECTILAELFHRRAELKSYELSALLDYVMHTAHDMPQRFFELLSIDEISEIMAFIKEKREPLFHTDSYSGHRRRMMSTILTVQSKKCSEECKKECSLI